MLNLFKSNKKNYSISSQTKSRIEKGMQLKLTILRN